MSKIIKKEWEHKPDKRSRHSIHDDMVDSLVYALSGISPATNQSIRNSLEGRNEKDITQDVEIIEQKFLPGEKGEGRIE